MAEGTPHLPPDWLHEIKHDGSRVLARKESERVRVWSRRGADFTHRFPAIAEAVRGLAWDGVLIDGEAVVLRKDGRSDFLALLTKRGEGCHRRASKLPSLFADRCAY